MKDALLRWFPDATTEVGLVPGRRADVVIPIGDRRVVVECQASAISEEAWARRTRDYTAAGVPVMWLWHRVRFSATQDPLERTVPAEVRAHLNALGVTYIYRPTVSGIGGVFTSVALPAAVRYRAGYPPQRPSTYRMLMPAVELYAAGSQYGAQQQFGSARGLAGIGSGLLFAGLACTGGCTGLDSAPHLLCPINAYGALSLRRDLSVVDVGPAATPRMLGDARVNDDPLGLDISEDEDAPLPPLVESLLGPDDDWSSWALNDAYSPLTFSQAWEDKRKWLAAF